MYFNNITTTTTIIFRQDLNISSVELLMFMNFRYKCIAGKCLALNNMNCYYFRHYHPGSHHYRGSSIWTGLFRGKEERKGKKGFFCFVFKYASLAHELC